MPTKVAVVFVDIPQNLRVERQMIRENLPSIEAAREYIIPRDQRKEEWGTHLVKDIADEIINNSGTVQDLYRKLDDMIKRHNISSRSEEHTSELQSQFH